MNLQVVRGLVDLEARGNCIDGGCGGGLGTLVDPDRVNLV